MTAPRAPGRLDRLEALQKRLASDPNWNGGWYYDNGGIAEHARGDPLRDADELRPERDPAETMPDPKAREAAIRANAKTWAQIYDGHSMVTLRNAIDSFDITGDYAKLKNTKVLYVQSPSDKLFDIALCPGYVSDMRKAGIDITYVELPTEQGPHGEPCRCRDVGADPGRLPEEPAMTGRCARTRTSPHCCTGTSTTDSTRPSARRRSTVSRHLRRSRRRHRRSRSAPRRRRRSAPRRRHPAPRAPVPLESPQLVEDARALARRCATIAELEAAIRAFEGCALKRTAKNTVFADGVAGAPVMIVGEAPGADEDRLGKPFVGVSGQLMDRMIDAIGMSRERDLYITNILFWRPPGNRTPTLAEQAICLAFTRRHIELAQPRVLVLAGGTAAKAVLDTTEGIMRLRGKWTSVRLDDGSEIPTLPTFHPAYLLRTPASKRQSWLDLLAIDKKLKELGVR